VKQREIFCLAFLMFFCYVSRRVVFVCVRGGEERRNNCCSMENNKFLGHSKRWNGSRKEINR